MFKWANILSTSRNQAQSLAHHHRLGTWQWHTAHMPFYCTAPPTRRAGLEYHRIASSTSQSAEPLFHFYSTSTPVRPTQPNSAARCRAERLAARAKQPLQVFLTCTACQVGPTQPAREAEGRGRRGREGGGRSDGFLTALVNNATD